MHDIVLTGGRVVDPSSGVDTVTDLALDGGRVAAVALGLAGRRVFDVSGQALSVAEGWHRGPTAVPVEDPALVGEMVRGLVADSRPNANMMGYDEQ